MSAGPISTNSKARACYDGRQKGFPLDASVIDYIRHLRRERPPSPRAVAELAKARWLDLRVREKEGSLMPTSECEHIIDTAIDIVLTNLHSVPPRLFPLDIQGRRRAEGVIHEIRNIIADHCLRRAQECEAALVTSEPSGDACEMGATSRRGAARGRCD